MFEKSASNLVLSSGAFQSFHFTEIFQTQIKNVGKQQNSTNIPLKASWIIKPIFVERCPHSDSNTIQKVHKLHTNEDVESFRLLRSHSEVFCEAKRFNVLFEKCNAKLFFVVVELVVLEVRTKAFGKCTENACKTTNTSNFFTVQGQFEVFFVYKLNLSRDKSSPKQHACP